MNALEVVSQIQRDFLERTVTAWRGYEKSLVIELVRSVDEAAFAFTMAPNRAQLVADDVARHRILRGAATALRPFLQLIKSDSGGVPWQPSLSAQTDLTDQYIINCGTLAEVRRLASLEKYGLAEATFVKEDHLVLEVPSAAEERSEMECGFWLNDLARQRLATTKRSFEAQKERIARRIDSYTRVHDGWFIGYDPDRDTFQFHLEYAKIYAAGTPEAGALPQQAQIAGRPFEDWNSACLTALGRVLHHTACATKLVSRNRQLELRNLLTVFARKEDIKAVWQQSGETHEWAERFLNALSLDAENVIDCENAFEMPLPYYIDFGRDFVLLPVFGALMNPHAGLLWHLKKTHRKDWDRSVDGREDIFRNDLQELFPSPRFTVPDRGFRLKRDNGSHLTDIDAVILDKKKGTLVLVQLKWPDIYGRSLAERNSRRLNLLKANDWVNSVHDWVENRTTNEIASQLGLEAASTKPPELLVISRHTAKFVNETEFDNRANWISWPRLVLLRSQNPEDSLNQLLSKNEDHEKHAAEEDLKGTTLHYHLPGLSVEVRVA